MSVKKENAAIVGVGAAACAVCCAGPIIGFLAAIGLGNAVGLALFGSVALVIGAIAVVIVLRRRQRRAAACSTVSTMSAPAPVDMPTVRTRG